jgi:hypothetical protein
MQTHSQQKYALQLVYVLLMELMESGTSFEFIMLLLVCFNY